MKCPVCHSEMVSKKYDYLSDPWNFTLEDPYRDCIGWYCKLCQKKDAPYEWIILRDGSIYYYGGYQHWVAFAKAAPRKKGKYIGEKVFQNEIKWGVTP